MSRDFFSLFPPFFTFLQLENVEATNWLNYNGGNQIEKENHTMCFPEEIFLPLPFHDAVCHGLVILLKSFLLLSPFNIKVVSSFLHDRVDSWVFSRWMVFEVYLLNYCGMNWWELKVIQWAKTCETKLKVKKNVNWVIGVEKFNWRIGWRRKCF